MLVALKGKVHVVEIMGRDAGWLTASVDLLQKQLDPPHLLTEMTFDLEQFLVDVKKCTTKRLCACRY